MFRRPKPSETEDDLLRQEQEFLAQQQTSAATVVKRPDKRKTAGGDYGGESGSKTVKVKKDVVHLAGSSMTSAVFETSPGQFKKKSRFREHQTTSGGAQRVTFDLDDDEDDPEEAMEKRDTHITSVLSKIMERDAAPSTRFEPRTTNQGFPSVLHRGVIDAKRQSGSKKPSLFAQQFNNLTPSSFGVQCSNTDSPETSATTGPDPEAMQENSGHVAEAGLSMISGVSNEASCIPDGAEINCENLDRLSQMSAAEILEEQSKLKAMLDPSLVSFIQSRHNTKSKTSPPKSSLEQSKVTETTEESMEAEQSPDAHSVDRVLSEIGAKDRTGLKVAETEIMDEGSSDTVQPPVKVQQGWVHMDQTETEKLEWMKDLPKPSAKSKTGCQARFDFNGQLMARDAEVPVREGLHHHGDEQEVPGYSLEELFTLSRSAVTQQRVLALQTLARVIYNCRLNQVGGELMEPLIPQLLKAGVLFLLRWSLDDSNEGVMVAAMEGLAALLVQPGDEDTLDRVFIWHRGLETTPMHPGASSADAEENVTDEGEEIQDKDKTDAHIAKQDVIKGLLRMKVLCRLRYILEVVRPLAPIVLNALAILIRISRHSLEAAHEVMKCPRLMQTILTEFLPIAGWKLQEDIVTNLYGYPVVSAMKLIKVLCLAGRNLAASLLSGGKLMPVIMRYITQEPPDMQLNIAEAFQLSTTSLHVWAVCVNYGLACDYYRELYPLLMQQVTLFQRLSIHPPMYNKEPDVAVHRLQLNRASAFISLLEGVVNVAAMAAELEAKLTMSNDHTAPRPAPPSINWSHVADLQRPLAFCCSRWLSEMTATLQTLDAEALDMVSCILNFLASFYEKYTQQACFRPVECLQNIEQLVDVSLVPFMTSATFYNVMINLKFQSSLRYEDGMKSTPLASLPDFGCHPNNPDSNYPSVRRDSTCGLAIGLLRLVHTLLKIHKGVAAKFCPIVENTYVTSYLKRICKLGHGLLSHLGCSFARFEHQALYYLLRIYHSVAQQAESCHQYSNLYHSAALVLFARLQPGDEYYIHDLMSDVLFNTDFIVEGRIGAPIAADLADRLSVTTSSEQPRPSLTKTGPTRGELLQSAYEHLPGIRNLYMVFLGTAKEALAKSRSRSLHRSCDIDSFLLPEFTGPLLPVDWMFLPLLHLYTEAQKAEMQGKSVKALPPHILSALVDTLRWVYLIETWRPQSLKMVPQAAKIARILSVFLTGSDLFLEDAIRHYLTPLLRLYTQPDHLKLLDFDAPIPGVTSFYDLYMDVLTQYEAVSFGDPLFAHFILLPMQQRFSVGIRKALWCEHAAALRALNVPLSQLILPLENFLHPQETNLELLSIYLTSLAAGTVQQTWCPLMYLVALHHISGFLFGQTGVDRLDAVRARLRLLRQVAAIMNECISGFLFGQTGADRLDAVRARFELLRQVAVIMNEVVLQHITCYQGPDASSPNGFSMYPTIPPERSAILQAAQKR